MNHAEVHSHMADYLEGELDLTQRALLDAHLDTCQRCSREFAEMRSTVALLRALPSPEPPPFFVENVMRRVREGDVRVGLADRLRDWVGAFATPQVALPAAALALGLLMANGNVDPASIGWPGSETGAPVATVRPPQIRPSGPPPSAVAHASSEFGPTYVWTQGGTRVIEVPTPASFGPPPVVAQAPHVSISLPMSGAAQPRSLTRWAPRSVLSLGSESNLGPSSPYSLPVGTQGSSVAVSEPFANQGSSFSSSASPAAVERDSRQPDPRLAALLEDPVAFSLEFSHLPVAEQQLWLRDLAEQALEIGLHEEALAQLWRSGDRRALELATGFAAELRRADSNGRSTTARVETGAAERP